MELFPHVFHLYLHPTSPDCLHGDARWTLGVPSKGTTPATCTPDSNHPVAVCSHLPHSGSIHVTLDLEIGVCLALPEMAEAASAAPAQGNLMYAEYMLNLYANGISYRLPNVL